MITVTSSIDGPPLTFNVIFRGVTVYLDTWAVIHLAERDPSLSRRFIALFEYPVDLLFSVTNAAELAGSQGASFDAVKKFLNKVGPHWIPVELDAFKVAKREKFGAPPGQACLSPQFLMDYFRKQVGSCIPNSGCVFDAAASLQLGPILDWVVPQRDSILQSSVKMDAVLSEMVTRDRAKSETDPQWLDRTFAGFRQFNPAMPATFVLSNLLRELFIGGPNSAVIKKGDGLDFCHSIIATAFSSFAALDKRWKRRIEQLPKPNKLAKIYYGAQLSEMVTDIESLLNVLRNDLAVGEHLMNRKTI